MQIEEIGNAEVRSWFEDLAREGKQFARQHEWIQFIWLFFQVGFEDPNSEFVQEDLTSTADNEAANSLRYSAQHRHALNQLMLQMLNGFAADAGMPSLQFRQKIWAELERIQENLASKDAAPLFTEEAWGPFSKWARKYFIFSD